MLADAIGAGIFLGIIIGLAIVIFAIGLLLKQ